MSDSLRRAAAEVMALLASKNYQQLDALTHGKRLSAALIQRAVEEFGQTIVEPPDDAYSRLDVVQVSGAEPPSWSVVMPIWTAEAGESDLEVQMTMISAAGRIHVRLDNILVP